MQKKAAKPPAVKAFTIQMLIEVAAAFPFVSYELSDRNGIRRSESP